MLGAVETGGPLEQVPGAGVGPTLGVVHLLVHIETVQVQGSVQLTFFSLAASRATENGGN